MSVSRQGEVACLPPLSCVGRDYSSVSKYQTLLLTIDVQMPGILIKSQFTTALFLFFIKKEVYCIMIYLHLFFVCLPGE